MSSTSKTNEFAPTHWQDKAACKTLKIDIFFPEESHMSSPKVYDEGKQFCAGCEVQTKCLAFAMHHERNQWRRFGLFGNKSPRDRVKLHQEFPDKDWATEFLS